MGSVTSPNPTAAKMGTAETAVTVPRQVEQGRGVGHRGLGTARGTPGTEDGELGCWGQPGGHVTVWWLGPLSLGDLYPPARPRLCQQEVGGLQGGGEWDPAASEPHRGRRLNN